jgi:hypothetical protein
MPRRTNHLSLATLDLALAAVERELATLTRQRGELLAARDAAVTRESARSHHKPKRAADDAPKSTAVA